MTNLYRRRGSWNTSRRIIAFLDNVTGTNDGPEGFLNWVRPTAVAKNVAVATTERRDNLDTPHSMWPDVHPPAS